MWVDPPKGRKYGFPKAYLKSRDGEMQEWLVRQGYPKKLIDGLGSNFHVRCWEVSDDRQA